MNVGLNCRRQNCGQRNVVSEHMRLLRIFTVVYCRGATNRSGAAKIGNFHLMQNHSSDILWCVDICGRCTVQWISWSSSYVL